MKNIEKCNLLFWATINLNQGHFTGKSGSLAILIISVIPINKRTIRNSEAVFFFFFKLRELPLKVITPGHLAPSRDFLWPWPQTAWIHCSVCPCSQTRSHGINLAVFWLSLCNHSCESTKGRLGESTSHKLTYLSRSKRTMLWRAAPTRQLSSVGKLALSYSSLPSLDVFFSCLVLSPS